MEYIELLFVSIGLGMDACAMAVCKGLCMNKMNWCKAFIIAMYFATFQLFMPIIGYYMGSYLTYVKQYDHIIAFILLTLLGIGMIKESFNTLDHTFDDDVSFKKMFLPSLATSIDALTVGITFSLLDVSLYPAVIIIFVVTFLLSILGTRLGQICGAKYHAKAELVGGIVLIIMGLKLLL